MKFNSLSFVAALAIFGITADVSVAADDQSPDLIDVQAATCSQFARAMSVAKPPEKPTAKQIEIAELAQDDLVLAMTWVNGYLRGRDGTASKHEFNRDWILLNMGKLSAICKANPGSLPLADAAAKL